MWGRKAATWLQELLSQQMWEWKVTEVRNRGIDGVGDSPEGWDDLGKTEHKKTHLLGLVPLV